MDLPGLFKTYLESQKKPASKVTIKNYLADLRQFVSWFEAAYEQPFHPTLLTPEVITAYKKARLAKETATSSLERHLSSLRKFSSFLVEKGVLTASPFSSLATQKQNEDPWKLKDFKNLLYGAQASHLTIKNYINDIKQFISFAANHESPSSINSDLLEEYRQYLTSGENSTTRYALRATRQAGLSPASVNRKLSSLRRYISFIQSKGLIKQGQELLPSNISLRSVSPAQLPVIARNPELAYTEQRRSEGDEAISNENEIATPLARNDENNATRYALRATRYSKFPPLRLLQKLSNLLVLGFDLTVVALAALALEKMSYLSWIAHGKQIFKKTRQATQIGTRINANLGTHSLSHLRSFALKSLTSTQVAKLPLHHKIYYHARFTRPNWYKKYHSYPVVHYFHFAALIIIMSALGFGLYRSFVEDPSKDKILAAVPTAPPRVMSFQGRLTDASDNPITSAKDLRFAIYNDVSASGAALLWQETQVVGPDTDGIFSVLLGSSTTIPATVFTDNSSLYLGVTVQSDSELTPRQQIATVAFATNSETLQGLYPITAAGAGETNVVLALDSSGNLTIGGSANPTFSATGGTFTLSGRVLTLSTTSGSNGNVNIQPDGQGLLNITKPIINESTTINNRVTTAAGAVEIDDLFAVLATSSGQSAFTLNQNSTGPLISASTSGVAKFTVDNAGAGTFASDLAVNGGNITSTGDLTINPAGGQLFLADTDTIAIGGHAGAAYNAISNSGGAPSNPNVTADNDLYVQGDLDVGGTLYLGGTQLSPGALTNYWQRNNGALAPANITDDLLLGGTATSTAKFAFINNIGSGSPTASISSNFSIIVPTGASPAVTVNALKGGSINFQTATSGQGDAGLASRLFIQNGGNVGIGTTAPLSKLTVDVGGSGDQGNVEIRLGQNEVSARDLIIRKNTSTPYGADFIWSANATIDAGNLRFFASDQASGEKVVFTSAGYVGIGDSGPDNPLEILSTSTQLRLSFTDATSDTTFGVDTNGDLTINLNATGGAGNLLLSDTDTFAIGGFAAGSAYNAISNSGGSPSNPNVTADNDLYVQGDLDVGGTIYLGGSQLTPGALVNYWQRNNGTVAPANITDDLLLGGISTASAKFGFINVGAGTPTATISSNLSLQVPTGANPATKLNILNGGTFGIRNSVGGDGTLSERLTILNNGNVGIGSTTPGTILDVNGQNQSIRITDNRNITWSGEEIMGAYEFYSIDASSPGPRITASMKAVQDKGVIVSPAGALAFYTALNGATETEKLRISSAGNVGIGTTTPLAALDVIGDASLSASLVFGTAGTNTIDVLNGDRLDFQTSPGGDAGLATKLTLLNNGNVGIGSTAPAGDLDVVGGTLADGSFAIRPNATATAPVANTLGSASIGFANNFFTAGSGPRLINLYPNTVVDGVGFSVASGLTEYYSNGSHAWYYRPNRADITATYTSTEVMNLTSAGNLQIDGDLTITGGNVTSATTFDSTLTATGVFSANNAGTNTIAGTLNLSGGALSSTGDLTISPSGNNVLFSDTTTLQIGGVAAAAYNAMSNSGGTPTNPNVTADNDLYVQGDLDVGGTIYLGGSQLTPGALVNYWQRNNGTVAPANITDDLLIAGISSSAAKFRVIGSGSSAGTASTSADLTFNGAAATQNINVLGGSRLDLRTSPGGDAGLATRVTLTSNGNVGIGDSTPESPLRITRSVALDSAGGIQYAGLASSLTFTGSANGAGASSPMGLYSFLSNNSSKGLQSATSYGQYIYNDLTAGNFTNTMYGSYFTARVNSATLGGDGISTSTATSSAGFRSDAINNAAGTVANQYSGLAYSYNNSTGAITTNYGLYVNAYNVSSGTITTNYGILSNAFQSGSTAITNSFGGYFQAYNEDTTGTITTAYGVRARAYSSVANAGLINIAYGLYSDVATTSGTTTGGINTGTAGYFTITNPMNTTAYGIQSQVTGVGTGTNYGVYVNTTGSVTNNYGVRVTGTTASAGNYALYVDAAAKNYFAGNVGIGSTLPGSKLDVSGTGQVAQFGSSSLADQYITMRPGGTGGIYLGLDASLNGGNGGFLMQGGVSKTLNFATNSDTFGGVTPQMVLDTNGNLGIGSTAPAAPLDVVGDIYGSSGISLYNTAVSDDTVEAAKFCTGDGETNCVTDFSSLVSGSGYWQLNSNVLSPGNSNYDLAIGGTASTSAKFQVLALTNGTITAGTASTSGDLTFNGTSATQNINILGGSRLDFRTSPGGDAGLATRISLTSNGNVGIGITTPTAPLYINRSQVLNNTTQDGLVNINTFTGEVTGNKATVGLYNGLTINGNDGPFTHTVYGQFNQTTLSNGNSADTLYGVYSQTQSDSTLISPAGNTASTSAAIRGLALNNAAGTITNQYGGLFDSYNASTGTVTNAYGVYGQAYNSNATGTLTTAYGVRAFAGTNVANAAVATAYGLYSAVSTASATTTGGITTGTAGRFEITTPINTTAYGVYSNVTGIGTGTNYGMYINTTGSVTNNYGVRVTGTPAAGGNYALYVDAAAQNYFAGNVGIGTTAPSREFDVQGDIEFGSSSQGRLMAEANGSVRFDITGGAGGYLRFTKSGPTEFMRIDNNGNLGIGSTAPVTKLDVAGNTNIQGYATASASLAVGYSSVLAGTGNAVFSGNVGVGLTNPSYKLDVSGTGHFSGNVGIGTTTFVTTGPANTTVALAANGLITGGIPTTNLSAIQFTNEASTNAGYGVWTNFNAYWSGSAWRQPRGSLPSYMTTANNHLTWSWRYAAAGSVDDGTVTPTEVMSLTSAGNLQIDGDLTITGGNVTSATTFDSTLTATGVFSANNAGTNTIAGTLNLSGGALSSTGDLTISPSGNNILLSDTTTLQIGGVAAAAYNAMSNSGGTPTNPNVTADNDLYVQGDLDVGGTLYVGGATVSGQYWQRNNGTLAPINITDDVLLGGTATASATFGFINVASGTPTATISSNFSLQVPTGANPAAKVNVLSGGTLNLQTSPGGDAGLTSRVFLASTGNVGIGSTVPTAAKLVVDNGANGTYPLSLTSSSKFVRIGALNSTYAHVDTDATSGFYFYDAVETGAGNNKLNISSANSYLSATGGNVGIGITTPIGKLNVDGTATGKALAIFNQNGGDQAILTASKSGVTKFLVDTNGNVGIGSTAPTQALDIAGALTVTSAGLLTTSSNIAVNGGSITSTGDLTINPAGGDVIFSDTDTLNIGGNAADVAYNIIGDSTTGATAAMNSDDDLFVEGDVDIAGALTVGGTTIANYWQRNSTTLAPSTVTDSLVLGGNTSTVHQFEVNGVVTGKALVALNANGGNQDIFTASSSGASKFSITNAGNINFKSSSSSIGAGNTIYGSDLSGGNLFLISTTHATKGFIYFQSTSNYIDLNNNLTVAGNATFTGSSIGIGTGANAVADIRLNGTSTLDVYSVSGSPTLTITNLGIGLKPTIAIVGNLSVSQYATVSASLAVGYSSVPAGTGNAVFSGNVGIRTTSPTAAAGLDVALGDIFVASTEGLDTRTASGTLNIGELNATTITIAGSNGTVRTLNLATGTGADTINIGTGATGADAINIGGTAANTIALGNTQTAGSISLGAAMTTGTISIGGTGLQTGTITLGGGTGAQTINLATGGTGVKTVHLGDGAVANVLTIGSTTGAAQTTINAGTADLTLASTDQVFLQSSKAAGGTTTEALRLRSTIDLGVADELLQIGDSAADFLTILGNGNVGIGSVLPGRTLSVNGTTEVKQYYDYDNNAYFLDPASAGTSLTVAGFVGIGTTLPSTYLDVTGATTVAQGRALAIINQTGAADIFTASTSGATKFVINNAGNVGIGSTSPGSLLDAAGSGGVYGTNLQSLARFINTDATATNNAVSQTFWANRTGGIATNIASISAILTDNGATSYLGALAFSTATKSAVPVERLRIDGLGNVGIGSTSPIASVDVNTRASTVYYSNSTNYQTTTSSTSQSFGAYQSTNLKDRLAIVTITTNSSTITSVTFGGTAMTQLQTGTEAANRETYFFYLANPPSGNQTVAITLGTSSGIAASAHIFGNVDQLTPIGNSARDTSAALSSSITCSAPTDMVFDTVGWTGGLRPDVTGTGQVQIASASASTTHNNASSYTPCASSPTVASWQFVSGTNATQIAAEINAVPGTNNATAFPAFAIDNNGNVGIGTNAPTEQFEFVGANFKLSGPAGGGGLTIKSQASTAGNGAELPGTDAGTVLEGAANYHLVFDLRNNGAADTIAMRYSSSNNAIVDSVGFVMRGDGNVGIGTVTPTSKLDVGGDIQTNLTSPAAADFALCHDSNGVQSDAIIYDCNGSVTADYAEMYPVSQNAEYGDILVSSNELVDQYQTDNGNILYNVPTHKVSRLVKSSTPYQGNVIGIMSNNYGDFTSTGHGVIKDEDNPKPVALNGRVTVKVSSENGNIQPGDYITTSSIQGVGMKSTKAGMILGRALGSYSNPDTNAVGTILVFVNNTWSDPYVYIAESGNFNISGFDEGSFEAWAGGYKLQNKGGFAEAVIARLTAGIVKTQQLVVSGTATFLGSIQASSLNVAGHVNALTLDVASAIQTQSLTASTIAVNNLSIGGQSLRDYILAVVEQAGFTNQGQSLNSPIATINSLSAGVISPLADDTSQTVTIEGNVAIKKTASSSGNLTVEGNASVSGNLSATDATIAGTLRAGHIIADTIDGLDARIASIAANSLTASSAAITNIYNTYTTGSNSAVIASGAWQSQNGIASSSATPRNDYPGASLIADSLYTGYADIASLSANLAYVPTFSADTATIQQGLMVFGSTSLADTSVTGQLSINGSLILAENSVNVLGGTFDIQPLRQGDVSFEGGLVTIDTDGNVAVNGNASFAKNVSVAGTLQAHIISPVPSEDLVIQLPGSDATNPGTLASDRPGVSIKNGSGSAVLKITDMGDIIASGAALASEFQVVRGATADTSLTQTVATASAGMAIVKTGQYERTIVSPFVTDKSLIYITPLTDTNGVAPFIARQTAEDKAHGVKGSFTIRIPVLQPRDVRVNWWIVN